MCVYVFTEQSGSGDLLSAVCIDIQAPEFMGQATAKCTIFIWTMELNPPHQRVTRTTTGKGFKKQKRNNRITKNTDKTAHSLTSNSYFLIMASSGSHDIC